MLEKNLVKEIMGKEMSKSKKMIEMYLNGGEISEISKLMGVRYNFSYNVISNYCRVEGVDMNKVVKESKKGKIVELLKEGKSLVDVSKELRCSYNYVFNVRKEMKK